MADVTVYFTDKDDNPLVFESKTIAPGLTQTTGRIPNPALGDIRITEEAYQTKVREVAQRAAEQQAQGVRDAERRAREAEAAKRELEQNPPPPPTTEEKLEALGLTVDELKEALGL